MKGALMVFTISMDLFNDNPTIEPKPITKQVLSLHVVL